MDPIRRPTQPLQRRGASLGDIQGPHPNIARPIQINQAPPASAPTVPVNVTAPAVPETPQAPTPVPQPQELPPVADTPPQVANTAPAPNFAQAPTETPQDAKPDSAADVPLADKESNLPPIAPKVPDRPYAQPAPKRRIPMVAVVAIIVSTGLAGLTLYGYFNLDSMSSAATGTSESQREPVTQGEIDDAITGASRDLQELPASDYSPEGLSDSTLGL